MENGWTVPDSELVGFFGDVEQDADAGDTNVQRFNLFH
jgi:hypothetical protein